MRVVVTIEDRFEQTPDGKVWARATFDYAFFARYLVVFSEVLVVARILPVEVPREGWLRADGDSVRFDPVPFYIGPWQYLRRARQVRSRIRNVFRREDAVILRVPSMLANVLLPALELSRHPYSVEVVGDPYDVFAPGAVTHPLRPVFRWWFPRQLRGQCAGAVGSAYVTEQALQRRYPPGEGSYSTNYSSVELSEAAFVSEPRSFDGGRRMNLITVGTLAQLYKSQDVLIDALGVCVSRGSDLQLTIVGDGQHRAMLEARARSLGLGGRVRFVGHLSSADQVRMELDQADLFVLPSRQEGLPRAMIEAMARGLPCVGSTVGGIPELLPSEDQVAPANVSALAERLRQVTSDPIRMANMSARNLDKARQFHKDILSARRREHYRYLRETTETWSNLRRRA